MNYTNSSCKNFNQIVLILQNALIPPNCILSTHSVRKCFNTSISYTADAQFYIFSEKIGSTSFFFHLQASTNPTTFWDAPLLALIFHLYFFKCFAVSKFIVPSQKADKGNSIRIIFIKYFKLLSRLILLRSILKIPITLQIIQHYQNIY